MAQSSQAFRFALLSLFLIASAEISALEQPKYEVLFVDGDIEYRRYDAYVVAETAIPEVGNWGKGARDGFMQLFDYISGENRIESNIEMTTPVVQEQSTKIAMTAPVVESLSGGETRMAFMLPSQFNVDSAPRPSNPAITIREIPVRLIASIRYSGRWTEKNAKKYKARLEQHLAARGIQTIGSFSTAVYNAPFTPPFLRRNEIHFEIEALPKN